MVCRVRAVRHIIGLAASNADARGEIRRPQTHELSCLPNDLGGELKSWSALEPAARLLIVATTRQRTTTRHSAPEQVDPPLSALRTRLVAQPRVRSEQRGVGSSVNLN